MYLIAGRHLGEHLVQKRGSKYGSDWRCLQRQNLRANASVIEGAKGLHCSEYPSLGFVTERHDACCEQHGAALQCLSELIVEGANGGCARCFEIAHAMTSST